MRNNLLSGTVGGTVGTILNTPYVHISICHRLSLGLRCADAGLDLTSSSHGSKERQRFRESFRSITGHTPRKFLPVEPKHLPQPLIKLGVYFSRLVMIMREEGPAALYKGFIPKVLRLAPGGGVLLLVVEFTLEIFRKSSYLSSPLGLAQSG